MSGDPKALGDVLSALIDRMGYRKRIDAVRAVEEWAHLAGAPINGVTDKVSVRNGVLYVHLRSASWRQQLHMQREQWRDRLNARLGSAVISEIEFR
ncbi:DUF721 domain-containing protein [soil metagenome]